MKKILITCLLLLVFLTGCEINNEVVEKTTMGDVLTMMCNQETFLVTISSNDCKSCEEFKTIETKGLSSKKLLTYELNYDGLTPQQIQSFNNYFGELKVLPSVYYVYNGKVISSYQYDGSEKTWQSWLDIQKKKMQ